MTKAKTLTQVWEAMQGPFDEMAKATGWDAQKTGEMRLLFQFAFYRGADAFTKMLIPSHDEGMIQVQARAEKGMREIADFMNASKLTILGTDFARKA